MRSPTGFRQMVDVVQSLRTAGEPTSGSLRPGIVLVISAFGSTTRELERSARLAQEQRLDESARVLDSIAAEHLLFVHELFCNSSAKQALELLVQETVLEIRTVLSGVSVTKQLSLRSLDRILAYGELLALHIARHLLADNGIDTSWADARRVVVTDDEYGAANPDMQKTQIHVNNTLLPKIQDHDCVLIQGFVGTTIDGATTTMGRESSTLTATILAALVKAQQVRIYTDVSGVCSADPKTFPDAITHTHLSFEQAAIAAHHGLKLLYTTTIEPANNAGIPVHIINATQPERSTVIGMQASAYAPIIIVPQEAPSDGTDDNTERRTLHVVLANQSAMLTCLGALAAEHQNSNTWHVLADPDHQVVTLHLPATSFLTVAKQIHHFLIRTVS